MKNKRTGKQVVISVVIVVAFVALASMTGTRRVSAATFTVTNTGDNGGVNPAPGAGTGTLRQAIIDANATAGADTINFAIPGLPGTITLAAALPVITDGLTINGPGAGVLTVSGNHLFRVFNTALAVTVSISGLTILNGRTSGVLNDAGTLTVTNCTFSGNTGQLSGGGGGGIYNNGFPSGGLLTVTNCTFSANMAEGGGIYNNLGTVTVTNSTFSGNTAFEGGGIINGVRSSMVVINSTFSGNTGVQSGGGISNLGALTVINSTFSGNNPSFFNPGAGGGGISNANTGTLTITNCTFSGNRASAGGGILNDGAATIKNSIIANGTAGGNCAGTTPITPLGVNYSTDNTCAGFTVVPSTGVGGLNLGPLQDNGGPTFTLALLPGSVAIDAVTDCTDLSAMPAPVTTDQRGLARPKDGDGNGSALCDAGAFELQPCVITCPANITQSNDLNQCGAVVNYSAPTTSGDCGTVTCSPASGSFFPVGMTTVNCDASGTTANPDCSFTVTVNDTQPPTITCPGNVTAIAAQTCPLSTSTAVTFPAPTVLDNCPGATAVCNPPSGSTFPAGTTTVTCTATDTSGNTASCSFTVSVFSACLQDDSVPTNVVLFNLSGEYRFCCNGTTFSGTGIATVRGCVVSIQHNPPDRRVLLTFDGALHRGTASLQSPPGTTKCTITDRNTTNNTCVCQ